MVSDPVMEIQHINSMNGTCTAVCQGRFSTQWALYYQKKINSYKRTVKKAIKSGIEKNVRNYE